MGRPKQQSTMEVTRQRHPWPPTEAFAVPEPPGSRREWGNESWETRYQRQHLELLDVAARLANKYGYDGTQISDIVAEAKVSKRAFYEHFDSKAECFADLIRKSRKTIIELMIAAAESSLGEGPHATFADMLGAWVMQLRTAPQLYVSMRGSHESALDQAQVEGIHAMAAIIAVAAAKLGSELDKEELIAASRVLTWGAFGVFDPHSIQQKAIDINVQLIASAICRSFGISEGGTSGRVSLLARPT
jgi:AcrR family transcriptional regulator